MAVFGLYVRPFMQEDMDSACSLLTRAFNVPAQKSTKVDPVRLSLEEAMHDTENTLMRTALVDGVFAGMVMAQRYDQKSRLVISPYRLAVAEAFRKRRVGSALIATIEADALAMWQKGRTGFFFLSDEIQAKNPESRFYARQGYHIDGGGEAVRGFAPLMRKTFS